MSSAAWDEIKRLAADFQRAQLASSQQKLSERNCIEIINKLESLDILHVYHTIDGRFYLTSEQVQKEISDELEIRGGRMNPLDLGPILSLDTTILEKEALTLARINNNIQYAQQHLMTKTYLDSIAQEINERLTQEGYLTLSSVSRTYNMSDSFMKDLIVSRLRSIINGKQDPDDPTLFYNEEYLVRHSYQVRGVLSAITRPVKVRKLLKQHHFQVRLFFSTAEELIAKKRLLGTLTGSRHLNTAMYIPDIYKQIQDEWVTNFWKQNGYLEFDALIRMEISEPQNFICSHFNSDDLTFLKKVCVGKALIDQIDGSVTDALLNGGWVDVYPLLPSVFSPEDGEKLLEIILSKRQVQKSAATARVFCETIVVSDQLVTKLTSELQQLMPARAKEAIEQGVFKVQVVAGKVKDDSSKNKKDDRRKKATGGKSGGGTQGRETKTKAVKNKHKGRKGASRDSDSEDEEQSHQPSRGDGRFPHVTFLSEEDLQTEISNFKDLFECPEELVEALASEIGEDLSTQFQSVVQSAYLATLAGGSDARKKMHQHFGEKVSALLTSIRLAEKSIKVFDDDKQTQLKKHLLKTQGTELVNELVTYLAEENHIDFATDKELTSEMRLKIIKSLPDEAKEPMMIVNKSLAGGELSEFLDAADEASAMAGVMVKKDNKKDRTVLQNHRCALLDQLDGSLDAPLTLHLASLILFQSVTGNMLHASGKFVPHILAYIKSSVPADQFSVLQEYQDLVMKSLISKDDESEMGDIRLQLETLTPKVKEIAVTFKKTSARNDD